MGRFWHTVKFLLVAGAGLFGDGYLNITIGLVVPMIGYLYYEDEKNSVPTLPADVIKAGLSIGMIVGQLTFGLLGDALGRHKVYGKELILTILGTLLLIVMPTRLGHEGVVAWMTVSRVMTGMGTGGDYPMTSSLSVESNFMGSRAQLVLTVFSFIGLGSFSAAIVHVILLAAFKSAITTNITHLQWVWRLLLGIGLVPLMATLYARLVMPETKPYENDIAFYGINLNQSVVLGLIGFGKGKTAYDTLWNTAVGNIIVSCAGYLPGFYAAIFLPNRIGRIRQQFLGSAIAAVLYAVWAGVTGHTSTGGLIALFTLSQFTLNAGPNATTFLLPVEVFPTKVRATAHGIAAASGKAGAVLTALAFGTVTERLGLRGVLGLFSGIMALCAAVTLLIPETKGRSIEEIENGVLYGEVSGGSDVSVSSGEVVGISEVATGKAQGQMQANVST